MTERVRHYDLVDKQTFAFIWMDVWILKGIGFAMMQVAFTPRHVLGTVTRETHVGYRVLFEDTSHMCTSLGLASVQLVPST
jgi:hypothetical protein